MDDLDALLADLESSTAHISKLPAFLPEHTPFSSPSGTRCHRDDLSTPPPPVPPPPSTQALNGTLLYPHEPHHTSQQSLGSTHKSSPWSSSPVLIPEEDHIYSFPNKRPVEPPTAAMTSSLDNNLSAAAMTSALGNNLSELDRLLLELNAVQGTPGFPSDDDDAPPLPACSLYSYGQENGMAPQITLTPTGLGTALHNGSTGTIGARSMETLEGAVPSPVPQQQQQDSISSATTATRQLDQLMACLSDFKDHPPADPPSGPPAIPSTPSLSVPPPLFTPDSSSLGGVPLELHIIEEGVDPTLAPPLQAQGAAPLLKPNSELSLSAAASSLSPRDSSSGSTSSVSPSSSRLSPDTIIDVSASVLSSPRTDTLVVLSHTPSSPSRTPTLTPAPPSRTSSSPHLKTLEVLAPTLTPSPTPSPIPSPKKASPLPDRRSPLAHSSGSFVNGLSPLSNSDSPLSPSPTSLSPVLEPPSASTAVCHLTPAIISLPTTSPSTSSSSSSAFLTSSSPGHTSIPSPAEASPPVALPQAAAPSLGEVEPSPSLDEALDKLLSMSFTQPFGVIEPQLGASRVGETRSECGVGMGMAAVQPSHEIFEDPVVPLDRRDVMPDTQTESDFGEGGLDYQSDGRSELDWAEMELKMVYDGADGSTTPLTEASWMEESITPSSSCPGTPDGALDAPYTHTLTLDRVSASGHIKSVIRRTKETPNVHPMYHRDNHAHVRRKMGPLIYHKSSSQDRLIEELQGKLGISRKEKQPRKQPDDWLTEGVVVMNNPKRNRDDHTAHHDVDKIIIPLPDSPLPQRRIISPPTSPPTPRREEPRRPPPIKEAPPPPVPSPPPPQNPAPAPTPSPPPPPNPIPERQKPPSPPPVQQRAPSPPMTSAPAPVEPPRPPPVAPEPLPPPVALAQAPPAPPRPPSPPAPTPAAVPVAAQREVVSVGCQTEYDPLYPPMKEWSSIMAQVKAPPPQGNKLDSMLGSLQSDLNKLGVQTVAKGTCGACSKPIVGQLVTAMGQTWHPEHFVCSHCQEEIGSRNFFERDGRPYCERDYHNLFSPRCAYCNGPILDKVVTALDHTWHPDHFFCAHCGSFFGPEGFHERDGKAYCRKDYFDLFAPKCGGCARAILDNYISALSTLWHPECFVCRECFTPFVHGSFFEHEGQPFCELHYHEQRGSLCSGCQKPISGRCISAMGRKFHPEHFVCAFCLRQLNKGTFKEKNDKPYCQGCFIKLFT